MPSDASGLQLSGGEWVCVHSLFTSLKVSSDWKRVELALLFNYVNRSPVALGAKDIRIKAACKQGAANQKGRAEEKSLSKELVSRYIDW